MLVATDRRNGQSVALGAPQRDPRRRGVRGAVHGRFA